jgi:hypothetical protein
MMNVASRPPRQPPCPDEYYRPQQARTLRRRADLADRWCCLLLALQVAAPATLWVLWRTAGPILGVLAGLVPLAVALWLPGRAARWREEAARLDQAHATRALAATGEAAGPGIPAPGAKSPAAEETLRHAQVEHRADLVTWVMDLRR